MATEQGREEGLSKTVGAAIARQRKAAGLTQAHVADLIGVEKETISRLETGVITPTIHRLGQFARLFNCPVGAFFSEHRAASGEDAGALAGLIGDLPRDDRQAILRVVAEFVSVARERDQLRQAIMERRDLDRTIAPIVSQPSRKKAKRL